MSSDQQHRCTVQVTGDGAAFLAFEPSSGEASAFSNSLFTLDLRTGTSMAEAQQLADHIIALLWGVSTTVF